MADLDSRPFVLARRWDRLGARLGAIVNAAALASAIGCDFRFVWPRGDDTEVNDATLLFDPGFLAAHEIGMADLDGRTLVRFDAGRTAAEAGQLLDRDAPAALEVGECFHILRFAGEDEAAAATRFRQSFVAMGWGRNAARILGFFDAGYAGAGHHAVHIRAGDIVTGGWRTFMAYEKYVPLPFIERAIEVVSAPTRTPVLVMSDSPACIAYLRSRHPQICSQEEICPGYASLGELDQAFADIVMMARSRTIVGPKLSAFSRLGANLGGIDFVEADRFAPEGGEAQMLADWIEGHREDPGWLAPFVARDICWYLDVFGIDLKPRRRLRLARRAAALEPDFTAALARQAREAALLGRRKEAGTAARRAVALGRLAARHSDPLVDALAARIAAECLALSRGAERSSRKPVARRLQLVRRHLQACRKLKPHQMRFAAILAQLAYQVEAAAWLAVPGPAVAAPSPPPASSPKGLAAYRSAERFDPVLLDLEAVSARLSAAVDDRARDGKARVPAGGRRR